MADGIRVQPQPQRWADYGDMRDRLIILRDVSRPLAPHSIQRKENCRICGTTHTCKTYHFQLDGDGTIMVSTTIWDRLQAMHDNGGFEKINVVAEPPDIHLSLLPIKAFDFGSPEMKGGSNGHR
jgi:hypothetical protein